MSNLPPIHQAGQLKSQDKAKPPVSQKQTQARDTSQIFEAPETLRPAEVLSAQQQVGNQVVQRALDKNERRKNVTNAGGELASELNDAIQKKRGGGATLPEAVQKEAKQALGRDFKEVRIHTDDESHRLSRAIHARAFTIGKDIFFKRGVFAPGTSAGRETIIHELTHVVQQSGGKAGGKLKLGAPDTALEKEADQMGKKHAASVSMGTVRGGAVQAQDEVQRQAVPDEEEEVQTQSVPEDEEETIQAQSVPEEEEETIQAQSVPEEEEETIQAQETPEEEELQSQEEEEIQTQEDEEKIPKAPPPPLPKRLKKETGFAAELAAKAKAMKSPKQRQNLEKLEAGRAAKVGARVSEQYKEDQANKPKSFGQKVKGFLSSGWNKIKGLAGKAATAGLGKLKEMGKEKVGEYATHFIGSNPFADKDKDKGKGEEEEEEKGEDTGKKGTAKASGGGGGSAIGTIMEQYANVLQENKGLKAKLAKLESAD